MLYFTSDLHLGHENIIRYCNRPFHSAAEMNGVLLDNAMSILKPIDELYILGDFASDATVFRTYTNALRAVCSVTHVRGNHDAKQVEGTLATDLKWNRRHYYLCHYPWATWRPNTVMLHGHCHGNPIPLPSDSRQQWRFDIGVDTEWDGRKFFPVSIEQIEKRLTIINY